MKLYWISEQKTKATSCDSSGKTTPKEYVSYYNMCKATIHWRMGKATAWVGFKLWCDE